MSYWSFPDSRAVSPVIAVILMVAVSVVLSAAVGAFVFDLGGTVSDDGQSDLGVSIDQPNGTTQVTVVTGEAERLAVFVNGVETVNATDVGVGDAVTVPVVESGDSLTIVEKSNGDNTVVTRSTVQSSTVSPSSMTGVSRVWANNRLQWSGDVDVASDGSVYATGGSSIMKLSETGTFQWNYSLPHAGAGVAVGPNGYVHGGDRVGHFVRLASDGTEQWNVSAGNDVADIVPLSSTIYTGETDHELTKWDASSGSVQAQNLGFNYNVYGVGWDGGSSHVYATGKDNDVRKLSSDLSTVKWNRPLNSMGMDVAINSSGYVFVGTSGGKLLAITPTNSSVWSVSPFGNRVVDLAIDNSDNVYAASLDGTVRKFDAQGNHIWTYEGFSNGVNGVAVDADYYVYASSGGGQVHKLTQTNK